MEFRNPDFEAMKGTMRKPVIVDGRNLYEPQRMKDLNFKYVSLGRPDPQ